jgi:precorrin isomerase
VSQTCAAPGRSAANNLHSTRDVIDSCRRRNVTSYILTIDQSKAFERVIHACFMFAVLEYFDFGPDFLYCVRQLYKNVGRRV